MACFCFLRLKLHVVNHFGPSIIVQDLAESDKLYSKHSQQKLSKACTESRYPVVKFRTWVQEMAILGEFSTKCTAHMFRHLKLLKMFCKTCFCLVCIVSISQRCVAWLLTTRDCKAHRSTASKADAKSTAQKISTVIKKDAMPCTAGSSQVSMDSGLSGLWFLQSFEPQGLPV